MCGWMPWIYLKTKETLSHFANCKCISAVRILGSHANLFIRCQHFCLISESLELVSRPQHSFDSSVPALLSSKTSWPRYYLPVEFHLHVYPELDILNKAFGSIPHAAACCGWTCCDCNCCLSTWPMGL